MIRLFAALVVLAALVAQPSTAATNRLVATVGPGSTIKLKKPSGVAVRTLKAGTYTITVRDRSAAHNFHLMGPTNGLTRSTTVSFVGTTTWRLRLVKGTYRFVCDPHMASMKGSFAVR